jgi:hypothetical protein
MWSLIVFHKQDSVVGWGTMIQSGRSRFRVPMRWNFFNWPNPYSRTLALWSTQPLTEMSTRNLLGNKREAGAWGWQTFRHQWADCQDKMWETRRLTTPWAFTDYYRDSFLFCLTEVTGWNRFAHNTVVGRLLYKFNSEYSALICSVSFHASRPFQKYFLILKQNAKSGPWIEAIMTDCQSFLCISSYFLTRCLAIVK